MPEQKKTGYPSIDRPWLKYYRQGEHEKALLTPKDKSVYRFYMENVFTDPAFPILKYFNATLTTESFVKLIHKYARAFRALGVTEDEMVPVYAMWSPEIAAIFFALNCIGAHPYFQKLEITPDALREETKGASVCVVFEPLWNDIVEEVFLGKNFKTIIVVRLTDSMRFPLKHIINASKIKRKRRSDSRLLYTSQIDDLELEFTGPIEANFKKNRIAVITTSSGTTSSVIKGIMDTNEGALANILGTALVALGYYAGKECFITLPPTASTAINCFFLLPLYKKMTVRIDPRADEINWTRLLLKYKPSVTLNTGSLWYSFIRNIDKMNKQNRRINLNFADAWVMGGSGVTPEQLRFINDVMKRCRAPHELISGYGCSECFGVVTVDYYSEKPIPKGKSVIEVGIPIPGVALGVFDEEGNELPFGERGEICINGQSVMHGYFNKPILSKKAFRGAWLKTGDIGEIDHEGHVYCYGRMKNTVINEWGETKYLFDIAADLRTKLDLEDCMVEVRDLTGENTSIVVYFVQKNEIRVDEKAICSEIKKITETQGVKIDGFREFKIAFPISPTTLKPQSRYTEGFFDYSLQGERINVSYSLANEDVWEIHRSVT